MLGSPEIEIVRRQFNQFSIAIRYKAVVSTTVLDRESTHSTTVFLDIVRTLVRTRDIYQRIKKRIPVQKRGFLSDQKSSQSPDTLAG